MLAALRATPVVVCPDRIGAVNQVRLVLAALPRAAAARARVVLRSPPQPDPATGTNAGLLAEFFGGKSIFGLPWLGGRFAAEKFLGDPRVRRTLRGLVA